MICFLNDPAQHRENAASDHPADADGDHRQVSNFLFRLIHEIQTPFMGVVIRDVSNPRHLNDRLG